MEPITFGLGIWALYAWMKKKAATPAAAAQTVSTVDQLAASLVAGQVNAITELRRVLTSQAVALGFTPGGAGHRPDANGVSSAEFLNLAAGSTTPLSVEEAGAISNLWGTATYAFSKAAVDGSVSEDEALDMAAKSQALANAFYDLAVKIDQKKKQLV